MIYIDARLCTLHTEICFCDIVWLFNKINEKRLDCAYCSFIRLDCVFKPFHVMCMQKGVTEQETELSDFYIRRRSSALQGSSPL